VLRRVHLGRAAPRTILEQGLDGVVAVHSLSKRSNLAGLRVGFYAGDAELVDYLKEVRKHVGMMVPGPAQAAGVVALADDEHVAVQRDRYRRRLERLAARAVAWSGLPIRCRPAASTCGSTPTTAGRSPSDWPARAVRW
jgi:aspartate/methionine/tyrosine aminotransferase